MSRILVAGFEPFGGCKTNSSMLTLEGLSSSVDKKLLPVEYDRSQTILKNEIERLQPDFVLCLGQAGGTDRIRLEKVAINFQGASIPDNAGVLKTDEKIIEDGVDGILTKVNTKDILLELKNNSIPAYLSLSAGGYICNTVYYTALMEMKGNALFVHLPYAEGENTPSMMVSDMVLAIEKIIEVLK